MIGPLDRCRCSSSFPLAEENKGFNAKVWTVFLKAWRIGEYFVALHSLVWRHCFWRILPSPLAALSVRTANVAHPAVFLCALKTLDPSIRSTGLCLGMSIDFLSRYYKTQDAWSAAHVLSFGASQQAVDIQADYNRRMEAGLEIHPTCLLQALTLKEQLLSKLLYEGQQPLAEMKSKLGQLVEGSYLIQFRFHSVDLIKTHQMIIVMDPRFGTSILPAGQGNEAVESLLNYYSSDGLAYLRLYEIHSLLE